MKMLDLIKYTARMIFSYFQAEFTEKLEIVNPNDLSTIPIYRVTNTVGEFIDPNCELDLTQVNIHLKLSNFLI